MSSGPQQDATFESLRSQIADDLHPVESHRGAHLLVPGVSLVSFGAVFFLWSLFGPRIDLEQLGALRFWGYSTLQTICACGLVVLALAQSFPGRWLSLGAVAGLASLAASSHWIVSGMTHFASPMVTPSGAEVRLAWFCLLAELILAIPLFLWSGWLLRQGLPFRPVLLGGLAGLGAGVAGDAVWRLFCPYSNPDHVVFSHTISILIMAGLGASVGFWWDRRRQRLWRAKLGRTKTVNQGS